MARAQETSRREEHPLFARVWSRVAGFVVPEQRRRELLAGATGRMLEIGAGDGRSFAHYPAAVTELVAIEPEPRLRQIASAAARRAKLPVTVLDGSAESLPIADGELDGVVSSLVLCSVSDQAKALSEMRRVLRPDGELRFYEHVVSDRQATRALQSGLDASGVWPRLGAGCHLARDTLSAIAEAGLELERVQRTYAGPGEYGVPFVLGLARRP
ncbi:MAG: class I SAM-dependent methyltransferase [Solirubrobacteraceae bacterium]